MVLRQNQEGIDKQADKQKLSHFTLGSYEQSSCYNIVFNDLSSFKETRN